MSKFLVGAGAVALLVLASSTAWAESGTGRASTRSEVETTENGDGYGYDFRDDLVAAGVMSAESGLIKVRQSIVRRTLIRPRTNFVPELYKSIEKI